MTSGHSEEHDPTAGHSVPGQALPIDTDVESSRAPISIRMLAVIFAGGIVGGLLRYEVVTAWKTTSGGFPWSTFAVNTAGAFVLALLVVLVLEVLPPTTYLRPLIGTGFCGALTTFSSVAVAVDELAAHGHGSTAVGYLLGSLAAGGVAALIGVGIGRRIPQSAARRAHDEDSSSGAA
jgi:fluoride exporter